MRWRIGDGDCIHGSAPIAQTGAGNGLDYVPTAVASGLDWTVIIGEFVPADVLPRAWEGRTVGKR